ncbi:flagellar biosynthetic protein FliO [Photobacterium toruni]|uniref:flagellar biosynthetic protein FliO n=1 Tax=Photobacterium toruni TaxID=1935446 RepID=UPI00210F7DEC|nr:flagellar biosynthetic protein FliO [Photobacterium toruni]
MFPNNYTSSIALTVLILASLLIIRYFILRHKNLLFKFMNMDIDMSSCKGKVIIQIETTTKLNKSSSLMVVNIDDERLLLSVTQDSISYIKTLKKSKGE